MVNIRSYKQTITVEELIMKCTINTYTDDLKLFKQLGLPPFKGIESHQKFFVGVIEKYSNYAIEVYVEPYPAQFWTFIVFNEYGEKIWGITTGSGTLTRYWESVEMIIEGMLIVEKL